MMNLTNCLGKQPAYNMIIIKKSTKEICAQNEYFSILNLEVRPVIAVLSKAKHA